MLLVKVPIFSDVIRPVSDLLADQTIFSSFGSSILTDYLRPRPCTFGLFCLFGRKWCLLDGYVEVAALLNRACCCRVATAESSFTAAGSFAGASGARSRVAAAARRRAKSGERRRVWLVGYVAEFSNLASHWLSGTTRSLHCPFLAAPLCGLSLCS